MSPRFNLIKALIAAIAAIAAIVTAITLVASPTSSATTSQATPTAKSTGISTAEANASVRDAGRADAAARRVGNQRAAGTWYDARRDRMVVNVTTAAAAQQGRTQGPTPRLVQHSTSELRMVTRTLGDRVTAVGSAWSVDPASNAVIVSLDSTVKPRATARLTRLVASFGDKARVERLDGQISTTVSGGHAIYAGGGRCSLGFNVRSGSTYYFLTAGHCTNLGSAWYANAGQTSKLGDRAGSSFPGNDYGIVRYTTSADHASVPCNGRLAGHHAAGNAGVGQPSAAAAAPPACEPAGSPR